MTVRQIEPIDRAELRATIQKWIDAHTDVDDTDGVGLLEDVLWEINAQPTLTPPDIVYCKDGAVPHDFEGQAVELAQEILGPWGECMPKDLQRGPHKED